MNDDGIVNEALLSSQPSESTSPPGRTVSPRGAGVPGGETTLTAERSGAVKSVSPSLSIVEQLRRDDDEKRRAKAYAGVKRAYQLQNEIESFIGLYGVERCLMLTLTFPRDVLLVSDAMKAFNNCSRRLLKDEFQGRWIRVVERREKTGVLHFHLLVAVDYDAAAGWDWWAYDAARRAGRNRGLRAKHTRAYSSAANPELRALWGRLRERLPKLKFGRHEATPIRDGTACCHYLSAYLTKGAELGHGVRSWGCGSGYPRSTSSRFTFCSESFGRRRACLRMLYDSMADKGMPGHKRDEVCSAYARSVWRPEDIREHWSEYLKGVSAIVGKRGGDGNAYAHAVWKGYYVAKPRVRWFPDPFGMEYREVLTKGAKAASGGFEYSYVADGNERRAWVMRCPLPDHIPPNYREIAEEYGGTLLLTA